MEEIVRISSGAPWEPIFGYSRAVRVGEWVMVSGTTALDSEGRLVGRGQMYVQARQAISNVASALARMGINLDRVIRTRVYVTDIDRFADVARAHQEMFGDAPPASTLVQVTRLVDPDMLVEIEADAYAGPAAAAIAGGAAARRPAVASKSRAPRKVRSAPVARARRKPPRR
jgi:enamine deaminase RidA (YjgF/YER057c/UK114 family)